LDVQRVEIGTQADRLGRGMDPVAAVEYADDAGPGQAGMYFEAEGSELVGNKGRGGRLLERRLRMGMNVVPPLTHLQRECGNFGQDVHNECEARLGLHGRRDGSAERARGLR
jgi:hypothetical protein